MKDQVQGGGGKQASAEKQTPGNFCTGLLRAIFLESMESESEKVFLLELSCLCTAAQFFTTHHSSDNGPFFFSRQEC